MITNFRLYGAEHIVSILIPILLGTLWILWGLRDKSEKGQKKLRITLVILIILIRSARYIMDIYFGVFRWPDLLSLQICHIDLILLVICLIKPNKTLFNFCFIIGIPMAISVALFPGTVHPVPGLPRAMLFIMSHTMLVMGALYAAVVLRLKLSIKYYLGFVVLGNIALAVIYFINLKLNTNYLYIMSAPKGSIIESFNKVFGWPGYIFALDGLAIILMFAVFCIGYFLIGKNLEIS
ncbi:MAG: TIGR02206 family membrane protein [Clostridia bacterium]|jgi:hypothetical integral membrane protein (TIGR02206 family)